jgi:hypothetical protein
LVWPFWRLNFDGLGNGFHQFANGSAVVSKNQTHERTNHEPAQPVIENQHLLGNGNRIQVSLLWFPSTQKLFFKVPPQFCSNWLLIFPLALAPVSAVEFTKNVRGRYTKRKQVRRSVSSIQVSIRLTAAASRCS